MNVECFLDTNVLFYAVAGDEVKRRCALALIETQNFAFSAQVLQEFYVTVTRKLKPPLTPEVALDWIEQFEAFPCVPIDPSLVNIAVEISVRHQISYWDGAIVAAAQVSGASTLFSEDLNNGQHYGTVHVLNPFILSTC